MNPHSRETYRFLFAILAAATAAPVIAAGANELSSNLGSNLTFYASFDNGIDADFAKGDPRIFTMVQQKPEKTFLPGNHTDDMTFLVRGEGVSGSALRFTKRDSKWQFYRVENNLKYAPRNWSGTVSVWLRVDPKTELAPGYCDPIQITPRAWNDAAFFLDFDKDGDPRDFRLGCFADLSVWNPSNRSVDGIPEEERPLIKVRNPPFAGTKWTHVLFTWRNFNTGDKDGLAAVYLDGRKLGELTGWEQTFTWDPDEAAIFIGINYIGLLDELSCYDRTLSDEEIRYLATSGKGLGHLLK